MMRILILFFLALGLSLLMGPSGLSLDGDILWSIRLPRILTAIGCGAATALGGAITQSMFRNPLATPSILGTEAGAACALSIGICLGFSAATWHFTFFPFLGALLATSLALLFSRQRNTPSLTKLLLGGFALNALLGAITALCIGYLMEIGQGNSLFHWLMGSFTGRTWFHAGLILLPTVILGALTLTRSHEIDALTLGVVGAKSIGVRVDMLQGFLIVVTAALSASSIAAGGALPFVSLVSPHLARMFTKPYFRNVAPYSCLIGAILTLTSDLIARTIRAPIDLDVGVFTTIVGAPYFIWILMKLDRGERRLS